MVMSTKEPTRKDLDFNVLEEKSIYHVINDSELFNTKNSIMKAYKGKLIVGTPITIPVGGKMMVPKKWGTMTLKSMSDSELGGISYLSS